MRNCPEKMWRILLYCGNINIWDEQPIDTKSDRQAAGTAQFDRAKGYIHQIQKYRIREKKTGTLTRKVNGIVPWY